jgi:hypothetical protein
LNCANPDVAFELKKTANSRELTLVVAERLGLPAKFCVLCFELAVTVSKRTEISDALHHGLERPHETTHSGRQGVEDLLRASSDTVEDSRPEIERENRDGR